MSVEQLGQVDGLDVPELGELGAAGETVGQHDRAAWRGTNRRAAELMQ